MDISRQTRNMRVAAAMLLLAAAPAFAYAAQDTAADTAAAVQVEIGELEQMREFKRMHGSARRDTEQSIRRLGEWLTGRAERMLAPGQQLHVLLRDVDLAGEFEPGRSMSLHDVRIVKDIYPPRIELHYRLTDASGQVLDEGDAVLRDSAFLSSDGSRASDSLRFEKRMLDDWLREQFGERR